MRVVLQRVTEASVTIRETGDVRSIGQGFVIFLGVTVGDTSADAVYLADKIAVLRIFNDDDGKMNRSIMETDRPSALVISQFTLYGDTRKGRRPSFTQAAPGPAAEPLYGEFITLMQERGVHVEKGEFGADMLVQIANDGPVTFLIESSQSTAGSMDDR